MTFNPGDEAGRILKGFAFYKRRKMNELEDHLSEVCMHKVEEIMANKNMSMDTKKWLIDNLIKESGLNPPTK